MNRTPYILAAAIASAALAPAASAALRLDVSADKAAPEGRTPKVVFSLLGAVKGRQYRIEAIQKSGQSPLSADGYPVVCANVLGRFYYDKARGKKLVFDPSPLTSYELGTGSPCTGTYDGKVLTPRRGAPARVLQTFRLRVPAMKLSRVHVLAN